MEIPFGTGNIMNERQKTCCFSGHRDIVAAELAPIQERLYSEIRRLVTNGVTRFIAGGAVGFDMVAAVCVLNLKASELPHLHLTLALPCIHHYKNWSRADKELLLHLLQRSDEVVFVSNEYQPGCMQKRNRYMVDRCDYLICYQMRQSGGTAYTVSYAKKQGLQITNLAQHTQLTLPI